MFISPTVVLLFLFSMFVVCCLWVLLLFIRCYFLDACAYTLNAILFLLLSFVQKKKKYKNFYRLALLRIFSGAKRGRNKRLFSAFVRVSFHCVLSQQKAISQSNRTESTVKSTKYQYGKKWNVKKDSVRIYVYGSKRKLVAQCGMNDVMPMAHFHHDCTNCTTK